ncbi:MAG: autotransporter-associated beta strand repeat-containing protein, partial [Hyphomicrobium sp.]
MRFISLGLAAAIGLCGYGIEPARAQTWNLYDGGSSLYLPYASGGEADSPKLHVGFDNSSASTLFTMDTGSVGIVASPDNFQPGAGSKYLGPGQQIYSSTGIIENGSWYTATQQIYGDVNGHREVVATAEVPVLLVTSITCQTDARHCTPTSDPTGISIMGVGFARESSTTTDKTPNFNPFLNLTSVRLTSDGPLVALPANWNAGYVVTSEGVQLGLSSANTANAGFVKLRPDPQYSTPGHPEWRPARMDIDVNGARGSGNVLMDTGVGVGYLNPPGAAVIGPLVQCPGTTDVRCAPNGTHIAVSLPGQTGEVALFRYDIGSGNVMQPEGVIVDDGSDVFFNTSRYVLQGLDYIYDAANGFIGYRWSGAADTDGHVTPMLALENDFIIPAGFSTSYPVTLFGDTRLIPQGVAEFDNVISGDERLVIDGPGRVILTAENDYTGETQIKSGTLSVNGSVDSHILVESGGTLGGTGELRGNVDVHAGGIYAPGNSIGTEVVRGNLHFDRGGIYAVELDASRSDKAEVHGSIDLTGAVLQLMIARGNYAPVTTYEIIDNRSGAPAAGQFSEIVNPLVFFLPTVNYASGPDDDVVLALVRSTDYSAAARTPNELAVATALERLPQGSPLIDAIQFQTLDGARQAFNALSGEVHATTAGLLVDQSRYVRQTLLGRLLQAGYGGEAGASLATGAAPTDVAANPAGMMTLGAGGMALGAGG